MQPSAQVILEGSLLTDEKVPVINTRIGVAGGSGDITDSKGQFRIKLPLDFIEGERVLLIVSKEKWVINYPLDGEWNLPNIKYQSVQSINVIIVPFGSKTLWSHERIEKYIARTSNEITKLKNESWNSSSLDFSYYLNVWATKYGFTPQEVKEEFDQWAAQVADTSDFRTLALKAFYEKNLRSAAINFEKAALNGEKKLNEISEERMKIIFETYENWRDAGNSYYNLYRFTDALQKYQNADSLLSREDFPIEWAAIQVSIGNSKLEIGERTDGKESERYYNEALEYFNNALTVFDREKMPKDWAGTQHNIGNVLIQQTRKTIGISSNDLLEKSISSYQYALEIYNRDEFPYGWAMTLNSLGGALKEQALRTSGEESRQLLNKVIENYRLALTIRTFDEFPEEWAGTQNNLGNALVEQASRSKTEEGQKLLKEATDCYFLVLQVYDRDNFPELWALTQNNLGITFIEEACRTNEDNSINLLNDAIDKFLLALEIRTLDELPQDWADTQNNLAVAYRELSLRTLEEN
ncbi:MAG: hypothetical protein Q8M94_11340, partial [Ignavibacteria bacterium]|nr:hypothetical protein [Ignavibacteria bacterium]